MRACPKSHPLRLPWAVLALAGLAFASCSAAPAVEQPHASSGTPRPSPQMLADIANRPAPPFILDLHAKSVSAWDVVGPFPKHLGSTPRTTDNIWWRALMNGLADKPDTIASAQMHCTAREVGRFIMAHDERPDSGLLRFMASRCGAASVRVTAGFFMDDDDGTLSDAEIYDANQDLLSDLMSPIDDKPRAAGIWFGRGRGKVVITLVTGERRIHLDSAARNPDPRGQVVLRGRFFGTIVNARALVSQGRFGFAECALDPAVSLPRFVITCPSQRADASAWIEIATFAPQRVLGRRALDLLIWPNGTPANRYQRPTYGAPRPIAAEPDLTQGLLQVINQVRRLAQQPALHLAPEQSAVAARLAPHFFAALFDESQRQLLDTISLGLIAGWHVPGTVHHGHLGSMIVPSADLTDLVTAMLAGPFGRSVLLDPMAHYLAVGTRYTATSQTLASLFGTYGVTERVDRDGIVATAMAKLIAERQQNALPPPRPLNAVNTLLKDAIAHIDAGRQTPDQVMGYLIFEAGMRTLRRIRGWSITVGSPDAVVFPRELVQTPHLAVAMAATVYMPRGRAAGSYVLLVLAA